MSHEVRTPGSRPPDSLGRETLWGARLRGRLTPPTIQGAVRDDKKGVRRTPRCHGAVWVSRARRMGPFSRQGAMRRLVRAALQLEGEYERLQAAMGELIAPLRPGVFLDVGCGDGKWTLEAAQRLGVRSGDVYGIEIHDPSVREARRRLQCSRVDLEAERWPFEDQSVELITLNQVLEHLKNAHFCLAECERVLRVGGHLALGIPNLSGLLNRFLLLLGRQPMCIEVPGPHVRSFTHRAAARLLRSNPAFELVRMRGSCLYPLPWPLVEWAARKLPGLSAYSFYLLKKVEHRDPSAWMLMVSAINATTYLR